jgi:hypothetical protein
LYDLQLHAYQQKRVLVAPLFIYNSLRYSGGGVDSFRANESLSQAGLYIVHPLLNATAQIGLDARFGQSGFQYKSDLGSFSTKSSIIELQPALSMQVVGPLHAIVSWELYSETTKQTDEETYEDYNRPHTGLMLALASFDVGVKVAPTVNIKEAGNTVAKPATLLFMSQVKVGQSTHLGLQCEAYRKSDLDEDLYKNYFGVGLAAETKFGQSLLVGLSARMNTNSAKDNDAKDLSTQPAKFISTWFDYALSEKNTLGLLVGYATIDPLKSDLAAGEATYRGSGFAASVVSRLIF